MRFWAWFIVVLSRSVFLIIWGEAQWHHLRRSGTVILNEDRDLFLCYTTTTADFSPDEAGFEMTRFWLLAVIWNPHQIVISNEERNLLVLFAP